MIKLKPYFQYFFLLFFLFLVFPRNFFNLPYPGLDASWNIAIFLAYKYNLIFGKDLVFTYGPLGIFHSRFPIVISPWAYLLFDLYFLGTFYFILRDIFKKHFSTGVVLYIFLSIIIARLELQDTWFFRFFLFYLFSFLNASQKPLPIIQAALLSIFCFYYKANLGLVAILIFIIVISYCLLRRKISLRFYLFMVISYLSGIWLGAWLLHVDLKGYLRAGVELIGGYNDAMSQPLANNFTGYIYPALLILLTIFSLVVYPLIVSIRNKELLRNLDGHFTYLIIGLGTFIIFKSAYVRADRHIYIFFTSISLVIALLYLFGPPGFMRKITIACCWLVILTSFWTVDFIPEMNQPNLRALNFSFLTVKFQAIKNYFAGIKKYDHERLVADSLVSVDNEYRKIIGDSTVDIIPVEISRIYFNGLRYDPRPVIQSYSAYNYYLDGLNCQKYRSPDAPEYILFSLNSVDGRVPFFDESRTKLALIDRYRIVGNVEKDLLLKKRETPWHFLQLREGEEVVSAKMGEDIVIGKKRGLQYSRIFVK